MKLTPALSMLLNWCVQGQANSKHDESSHYMNVYYDIMADHGQTEVVSPGSPGSGGNPTIVVDSRFLGQSSQEIYYDMMADHAWAESGIVSPGTSSVSGEIPLMHH